MLDFGTEMNSQTDPEREDDLFSPTPATADAPAKTAAAPESTPETPAAPKRPWIKPPTLPKYTEQQTTAKEKILPALKGNPHFLHRRRKAEEFSEEDKREVSRILKAARTTAGLSPQDVEQATQIRAHYLVALEDADYNQLPQPVYVLAYLRRLCELYDIPEDEENQLVKPWRNIPYELPEAEKLSDSVQRDDDPPNTKTLARLQLILISAAAMIIIGVLVLIIVLIVSHFSGKDIPESAFNNAKLLEIQPKPELIVPQQQKVQ
ncbi:MAG: helix-turn-helix domain-containing protein [Lentisphaerae bacterium]|nr:helix-turn-helix domain-containing protein [Lentisphaerota bacterium]